MSAQGLMAEKCPLIPDCVLAGFQANLLRTLLFTLVLGPVVCMLRWGELRRHTIPSREQPSNSEGCVCSLGPSATG